MCLWGADSLLLASVTPGWVVYLWPRQLTYQLFSLVEIAGKKTGAGSSKRLLEEPAPEVFRLAISQGKVDSFPLLGMTDSR